MKNVFTITIVVILTVLGIATSCKNDLQDSQPENQAVVNFKPLNNLVESESTSNLNARVAALATQQLFKYSSQVVGCELKKNYSVLFSFFSLKK